MSLTLIARAGLTPSAPPAGSQIHVLKVAEDDVVTLTVASAAGTALSGVTWTHEGSPLAGSTPVQTNDPASEAVEISISGTDQHGTYRASTLNETSNLVILEAAAAEDEAEQEQDDDGSVIETRVGEMDRPFAFATLLVVAAFSVAIIWIAWRVVSRIDLPASVVTPEDVEIFGTWAERSASIVHLLALAGGLVTLFLGAWLAAIETRGRLRIPAKAVGANAAEGERGPIDSKTAEAIGAILGSMRRMRGAIAVVVAGVLIVGFAIWGATGA